MVKNKFIGKYFGKTRSDIVFHSINYFVFALVLIITAYPFIFVIQQSLKSTDVSGKIPRTVYNLSAYITILNNKRLVSAFLMTLWVVVAKTLLMLFSCMITAYPLSRKHLRGRVGFLAYVVITMLFSGGLIPSYILFKDIGLKNNLLVYVVPGLFNGFYIIIMKNFFQEISVELEEAAQLDGANDLIILFRIFLPVSMPIFATVGLWTAVGAWNDWMTAVLYIKNKNWYLIQNFLRTIFSTSTSADGQGVIDPNIMNMAESVKMAAIVVGTLPIVIIYPFVQKHFVKGVMLGSIKG